MDRKMAILRLWALSLSLFATLLFLSSSGSTNQVCISKGGRFLPYPLAGMAPGKTVDLTFCCVFRARTCCGVEQTHSALLSVRKLAVHGEAGEECVNFWELLECSICDPKIGVQCGSPLICASLCDRIFHACSEAYFGMDSNSRDVAPCSPGDLVCAKASHLFSNGTELCNAAGFSVMSDYAGNMELSEGYCYGSQASLDSINNSWKSSRKKQPKKSENEGFGEDAFSCLRKLLLDRKVYCALVIIMAGTFFFRCRRDPHFKKIAAILRDKEKLDAETNKRNKNSLKHR